MPLIVFAVNDMAVKHPAEDDIAFVNGIGDIPLEVDGVFLSQIKCDLIIIVVVIIKTGVEPAFMHAGVEIVFRNQQ